MVDKNVRAVFPGPGTLGRPYILTQVHRLRGETILRLAELRAIAVRQQSCWSVEADSFHFLHMAVVLPSVLISTRHLGHKKNQTPSCTKHQLGRTALQQGRARSGRTQLQLTRAGGLHVWKSMRIPLISVIDGQ